MSGDATVALELPVCVCCGAPADGPNAAEPAPVCFMCWINGDGGEPESADD